MKVQIRRGVFETNSSSVHTLTISDANFDSIEEAFASVDQYLVDEVIKNGIIFGRYTDFGEECDIQDKKIRNFYLKCDEYWHAVIENNRYNSIEEFFETHELITSTFKELGIYCECNMSPKWVCENRYWCTGDLALQHITNSIDLIKYLFDENATSACYDDCYDGPYIKDGYKLICEHD